MQISNQTGKEFYLKAKQKKTKQNKKTKVSVRELENCFFLKMLTKNPYASLV